MNGTKKHPVKKWEVSLKELHYSNGVQFKVTRRLPEMSVAETRVFDSKEEAIRQMEKWLRE